MMKLKRLLGIMLSAMIMFGAVGFASFAVGAEEVDTTITEDADTDTTQPDDIITDDTVDEDITDDEDVTDDTVVDETEDTTVDDTTVDSADTSSPETGDATAILLAVLLASGGLSMAGYSLKKSK